MRDKGIIKVFPDTESLAEHAAECLIKKINKNFSNQSFSIALSGGTTPKKIFSCIASKYSEKINWHKLKVFFGDERCVHPSSDDSNYKMADETLFKLVSIPKKNIFRIKGENKPSYEASRYSKIVAENLPLKDGLPQFDVVMLGLGDDGHVASIFPNQLEIFNSNKIYETAVHPSTGQKRISITGKIINNAKLVVFIVTGEGKSKILYEILTLTPHNVSYPASFVNPTGGELIWLLDAEASKLLNNKISIQKIF
ncbi:6-phosphogluconolactonase [Melioribacteraceae bacterium 4301-Me]|uniref:6-phosphogluconolactonase n=1 Tax=Pyranulibacter aquaticus TaxID=3163344 RepID=UPI0035965424